MVYVFVYVCICMCKCSYSMYAYDFVPMISMFCGMCIYDAVCVLEREGLLFLWDNTPPMEILTSESCKQTFTCDVIRSMAPPKQRHLLIN